MRALDKLVLEIDATTTRILLPEWGTGYPLHGMGRTAYGYVMNCLAFVDLLSRYRTNSKPGQTSRMVDFLVDYLGYTETASRVVIQIWRHNLMHTGFPGTVEGSRTGERYKYLMQWGEEHLPRNHHMQFQPLAKDPRILNLGVRFLAEDLADGARRYFDDVGGSSELHERLLSANRAVSEPARFAD